MKIKKCTKCNKEKPLSEFHKNFRNIDGLEYNCKDCRQKYQKEYQKLYYFKNKDKKLARQKERYCKNKQKILAYNKEYYIKNKQKVKEYQYQNREHINKQNRERRQNNIELKILHNLRNRVYFALKKNFKILSTMFLIGCEIDYLMYYLQQQFQSGMSWDNYGDWHIDHIKPCSKFDLNKPEEQRVCFHYTNLQPLWAKDNWKKQDKYEQK